MNIMYGYVWMHYMDPYMDRLDASIHVCIHTSMDAFVCLNVKFVLIDVWMYGLMKFWFS